MSCEPFDCAECGERHERCEAHSVRCPECDWSGGNIYAGQPCIKCGTACIQRPCRKWPLKHLSKCEAHGAGNHRSKRASERIGLEEELNDQLLKIEGHVVPVRDPYSFLAEIAGELSLIKTQLGQKVQSLPSLEDAGSDKYASQLQVTMAAYERFLTHCAKVATDMTRLDLDSRIAKLTAAIDDETANIVTNALSGALGQSSLPPDERDRILRTFGQLLREPQEQAAIAS